jgi:predicted metal-binding membrane protein
MATTPPSLTSPSDLAGPPASRVAVGAGIAVVVAVSWAYVLYMAWGMANMDAVADSLLMPSMMDWGGADLLRVFLMWSVMMAAMMLPSATPLLLLIARINYGRFSRERAALATGVFGLGYIAVWIGFSLLATLAQWGLLEARLVSPMMDSASPFLSAALLATAGTYEFTPLKHACLARCRSPLSVLMTQWREGYPGAFAMGLRQGAYCTGCCWLLMALLFVFGVMNLIWIAALSVLVLLEKLLRQPRWFSQATGVALLAWGALVAGQAVILLG